MKDVLYAMLLDFFEKNKARQKQDEIDAASAPVEDIEETLLGLEEEALVSQQVIVFRAQHEKAMRVFTDEEKSKLTKASYQFLSRLLLWQIFPSEIIELVITQLFFSESPVVDLHETKWVTRNTLGRDMDTNQLAFLDLVLYQKEDGAVVN